MPGKEFIKFLAALTVLPSMILKNRMNSTFFSNHPGAIHAIIQNRPRQNSSAQTEATTFTFSSVFILIQWVGPSVQ